MSTIPCLTALASAESGIESRFHALTGLLQQAVFCTLQPFKPGVLSVHTSWCRAQVLSVPRNFVSVPTDIITAGGKQNQTHYIYTHSVFSRKLRVWGRLRLYNHPGLPHGSIRVRELIRPTIKCGKFTGIHFRNSINSCVSAEPAGRGEGGRGARYSALVSKQRAHLNEECCAAVLQAAQRKLHSCVKGEAGTRFTQKGLFMLEWKSSRRSAEQVPQRPRLSCCLDGCKGCGTRVWFFSRSCPAFAACCWKPVPS